MISLNSNPCPLRAGSSLNWRCTSVSDIRRLSGREEKGRRGRPSELAPVAAATLARQKTVRQHHTHRVPVKARPQPPLILVLAQQTFDLLVILLQQCRRERTPPSAPAPSPDRNCSSSTAACRRRHPHRSASPHDDARRRHAPATQLANRPRIQPWLPASRSPSATTRHLRSHQDIGPLRRPAAPRQGHGEVGADSDHVVLATLLQAIQEVGVVAVVGVRSHTGAATPHSRARSRRSRAICGLVWKVISSGTLAFARRPASWAQDLGR